MKKLIIVFLSALLIAGCGKKNQDQKKASSEPKQFTTTVDNDHPANVALKYSLKKGQKYSFKLTSITNQIQSVKADSSMKQQLSQNVAYYVDVYVENVDNDGSMSLKATVNSVNMNAETGGKKFSYHTGQKLDSLDKMKYMEYEILTNNPFNLKLSSKGEILELYNTYKIVDKLISYQKYKGKVTQEQKQQLQNSISEGMLKPVLQQLFRLLPDHNVGIDSVWTHSNPGKLAVFEIVNIAKYKLTSFEKTGNDKLAVYDAGLEMKCKGKNKFTQNDVDYNFDNPKAQGSGKVYFNMTKGCVQKSSTKTVINTSLMMTGKKGAASGKKMTRRDYMESTNILELL
jgi:hypothetical protein